MTAQLNLEVLNRLRSLLILKAATARPTGGELPFVGTDGVKRSLDLNSRFKSLFVQCNQDGSGLLSFQDFKLLVRKGLRLGEQGCPDGQIRLLFDKLDADGSGKIDLDEFLEFLHEKEDRNAYTAEAMTTVLQSLRQALRRQGFRYDSDFRSVFRLLDLDDDNGLSQYELYRFCRDDLRVMRYEVSDRQLRMMYQVLDWKNTNSLDAEEFVDFLRAAATASTEECCGARTASRKSDPQKALPASSPALTSVLSGILTKSASAPIISPTPTRAAGSAIIQNARLPSVDRPKDAGLTGGYVKVPEANRLNRIENQLCECGVNVRGKLFHGGIQRRRVGEPPSLLSASLSNQRAKQSKEHSEMKSYLFEHCV